MFWIPRKETLVIVSSLLKAGNEESHAQALRDALTVWLLAHNRSHILVLAQSDEAGMPEMTVGCPLHELELSD